MKRKEKESRKRAAARGTRKGGPSLPTRQDGAGGSELTLEDLSVPLGLTEFAQAVALRLGVGKTNHFLAGARFVAHSDRGCPLVVAPGWIATKIEFAGREFLKDKGWKVVPS